MKKHAHSHNHMHMARRKMSHVIDELYTTFFRAGGKEVNLHLVREASGLRLLVEGDYSVEHQRMMETTKKMLQPELRNPALVEAYWELAGGDQYTSDSELNLVGQMLDSAEVEIHDGKVKMDLFMAF